MESGCLAHPETPLSKAIRRKKSPYTKLLLWITATTYRLIQKQSNRLTCEVSCYPSG